MGTCTRARPSQLSQAPQRWKRHPASIQLDKVKTSPEAPLVNWHSSPAVTIKSRLDSWRGDAVLGQNWRLTHSIIRAWTSLAANQPFCEFLHSPPPSSYHHLPSIEPPIHLQLISTPVVDTITMVAIARSFGAARVAARGFSNAGMFCACLN